MNGLLVSAVLLAPASPVPALPKAPPAAGVDRNQSLNFARVVYTLAINVKTQYAVEKENHDRELIEAAVRGLYDAVGAEVPEQVRAAVRKASGPTQLVEVLADARGRLGNDARLAGAKSLFAAMNGFKYATDPSCGPVGRRTSEYASIDQDFGVGIELEGVVGVPWTLYSVESQVARGQAAAAAWFGPIPRPEDIPCPATFPWRVRRVIPGSPAQKAGVRPGDVIDRLDGTEVTAANANKLFANFASTTQAFDPATGLPVARDRKITFRREGGESFAADLKAAPYVPETAFGVVRLPEDKWDCLLDREYKIGYVRLGAVEMGLDAKVAEMLDGLTKQGCRALILDLRWCPGGYVTPGTKIAGLFLKDGAMIAKMDYRDPARAGTPPEVRTPPGGGKFADLPLVLLVGQETVGGGELIASALRDNDRCVVVGQRTVGRAAVQQPIEVGLGGTVQYRVTIGTSLRPNGKNRQRKPDSGPLDDWGVRPDEGLEVPVTADKSAELRRQAELHSLRPADSREALTFDDPATDPHRLAALAYLRKKLGPRK
ncbi:MAG TPA: S41 family peptidase [Gemmata sp.]|nr:S41 family peptidase [Gemmata sp.]